MASAIGCAPRNAGGGQGARRGSLGSGGTGSKGAGARNDRQPASAPQGAMAMALASARSGRGNR